MTKQQILDKTKDCALIEVYKTDETKRVHTDHIKYVGLGFFDNSEIDVLPFDSNGECNIDLYIMDKAEYCSTVIVNSTEQWELDDDDTIAVIVVNA